MLMVRIVPMKLIPTHALVYRASRVTTALQVSLSHFNSDLILYFESLSVFISILFAIGGSLLVSLYVNAWSSAEPGNLVRSAMVSSYQRH